MRAFTKRESEIKIIPEERAMTGGMHIINAKGLRNEIGDLNVQGVTFVNELGTLGNFEVDSNGDGIADGWTSLYPGFTGNLDSDNIYGTKAQKIIRDIDSSSAIYYPVDMSNGTYYLTGFVKRNNSSTSQGNIRMYIDATFTATFSTIFPSLTNVYEKLYRKFDNIDYPSAQIAVFGKSGATGNTTDYALVDGLQLINLTKLGILPSGLASYFGKLNWADLTAEECKLVIPDYVNGIQSVGYSFNNGTVTPVLENRGKNLYNYGAINTIGRSFSSTNSFVGYIPVESNTTYTVSAQKKDGTAFTADDRFWFVPLDRDYGVISWQTASGIRTGDMLSFKAGGLKTTTTAATVTYFGVFCYDPTASIAPTYVGIQLEESPSPTPYESPKKDKIILPELHSLNGLYSDLNYERIKREEITTNASGVATLSHTANGTYVAIKSPDGSPTWGTVANSSTISGLTASTTYQIFYILATPIPQNLPTKIPIYTGHNNIICEGAAIAVSHTKESNVSEILAFAEGLKTSDSKSYFEYQPVNFKGKKKLETSKGHKITIDDLYLDGSWDQRFDQESFTVQITDTNEDESNTVTTKYHGCQIDSLSRDEGDYLKRGVEISAECKEVIES